MNQIQVQLRCGCWILRPAETPITLGGDFCDGDMFPCRYGHGDQEAVSKKTHQWRARCMDCRFGGWFGQSEVNARGADARHTRKEPTHRVGVAYDKVTKDGKGEILRWDDLRHTPGRKISF